MNFISLNTEILNSNIDGQAFKLYCLLESYCYGDRNDCFPSQNTLAARMNKSIRTIQRYLKTLKDLGFIIIKRRGSTSNLYILPKKLNKKVQETAQKIQEKCSILKAASKNGRSSKANKNTKNNTANNIVKSNCINCQNDFANCEPYPKSHYETSFGNNTNFNYNTKSNYRKSKKISTFNNYTQRNYDFDKLEQALLGNIGYEYTDVLK